MVFSSGCYYGVLNVLDPTIRYDANGKIIGSLRRLPQSSNNQYDYRSDDPNGMRDQRTSQREVVVVETVDSVHSRMDDSYQQSFHPHITYVSETDMDPGSTAEPTFMVPVEDIPPTQEQPQPEPLSEPMPPEPVKEPLREQTQPSPEVWSVPAVDDNSEPVQVHYVEEMPLSGTAEGDLEPPVKAPTNDTTKDRELMVTAAAKQETDVNKEPLPEQTSGSPVSEQTTEAPMEGISEPAVEPKPASVNETDQESAVVTPAEKPIVEATKEPKVEQGEKEVVDLSQEPEAVVDLVQDPELSENPPQEPKSLADLTQEQESVVDLANEPEPEPKEGVVDLVQDPAVEASPAEGPEQKQEIQDHPIFVEDPQKKEEEQQAMVVVADYMDATPLFKTIQRKNWQAVLFFLRTGSFSFSPLTGTAMMQAVQEQAQTWVSKKDENGRELWRQLPLHAAVCFGASQKVVEKLIIAYPEALKSPDLHGNLPLHLAYIFDAEDTVLSLLMRTFPAALHVMNFQGFQPIQCSNEISSETFQYNAELFGALSDYTRAVAENDPDKLLEQLQEVRKQLKQVNDTLFAAAAPRKPEPIKEYMMKAAPPPTHRREVPNTMVEVDYSPGAFIKEVALGLCPMGGVKKQLEHEIVQPQNQPHYGNKSQMSAPKEIMVLDDVPTSTPSTQTCRVMEYCPKTKTWKEV